LIESYLTGRESLRLLVVVVDGEIGAQPSDAEMVRWGTTLDKTLLVVATKLDRIAPTRRDAQLRGIRAALELPPDRVIAFSAKEKLGVDELWQKLLLNA
jgi:GTP-binding protein